MALPPRKWNTLSPFEHCVPRLCVASFPVAVALVNGLATSLVLSTALLEIIWETDYGLWLSEFLGTSFLRGSYYITLYYLAGSTVLCI